MKWRVSSKDGKKPCIKRWIVRDGKGHTERYPIKKYKHLQSSPQELENLVKRLNHPFVSKEAVKLKHAFISPELLDKYRLFLDAQLRSKERAKAVYFWTFKYFLQFFIGRLNLINPLEWHIIHETDWANYLLSDEVPASASTKKEIVVAANRFMAWLHKQRPDEVPPLKFTPITKSKLKAVEAERKLKGLKKKRYHIKDSDWLEITRNADPLHLPFFLLGYEYGLRRAEVLGLTEDDVRLDFLSIERQLVSLKPKPKYDILKDREPRKVNHWYGTPKTTREYIRHVKKNLMCPDTLTSVFKDLMEVLELPYTFQDLRHTFVTRAMNKYKKDHVRLAVGHESMDTTMEYLHDARELNDTIYKPAS